MYLSKINDSKKEHKGIEFIKENYESEHTLPFDTILDDIGVLCKRNGGTL